LYTKHTVFYDLLPHYFLKYDVLDLKEQQFLSTQKRKELLEHLPVIFVPILYEGTLSKQKQLASFLVFFGSIALKNYNKSVPKKISTGKELYREVKHEELRGYN
jgi:hypothetical protein